MCGGGAYFVAVFDHTTRDLRQRRAAVWRVARLRAASPSVARL
jgi:hypothetical protein